MHSLHEHHVNCSLFPTSARALQTAASCKAKGAAAIDVHGIDLSKSAEVNKFIQAVLAKYETVDVLVNNAGMGTPSGSGPIDGEPACLSC